MQAKATAGMFPAAWIDRYVAQIDDAIDFMKVVHAADSLAGAAERTRALGELGDEILRRNGAVLCAGVMNQAFPATRQIGGRWFDEVCWPLA
jgi:hypothetical protein